MSFVAKGPNINIAGGSDTSDIIPARGGYEGADFGIMVHSPAVLAEAGKFEVTDAVPPVAGSTWRTWQTDAGVDIAIPVAGKSILYDGLQHATGFRIKLGGAAAVAHVFNTSFVVEA